MPRDVDNDQDEKDLKQKGKKPDSEVEEHEDEEEGADESLAAGGESDADDSKTDEEREAIRERRRNEKRAKKERERRERDELKRTARTLKEENDELRSRMENLERGQNLTQLRQVDAAVADAASLVNALRSKRKEAIAAADPDLIDAVDERLYKARRKLEDLEAVKERATRPAPTGRGVDPNLVRHAKRWMSTNDWYDPSPNTTDEDSVIVTAIDRKLVREGSDPSSNEHWEELTRRVKKRLPHRFDGSGSDDEDEDRGRRRGGPPVGGAGREGGGPRSEFRLTEDHKQALRDANIEPGTERYKKMIESFKEAAKRHGTRAA